MSNDSEKLLPEIPVLAEYQLVKDELIKKINKLNSIETLTEDNKKEVKNGIAEINKVKERISRYRIDETNKFLSQIQPYVDKCKELEKLCDTGIADIKAKVKELEEHEKELKKEMIKKLFDFTIQEDYPELAKMLNLDMFFNPKFLNKTSSITMIEKELKEWLENKSNDVNFIKKNTDEPSTVLGIYLKNGLNLTNAIEQYQQRFVSEAEIKAIIETEKAEENKTTFEKKMDIIVKIKQLPKSKVAALQSFLNSLNLRLK